MAGVWTASMLPGPLCGAAPFAALRAGILVCVCVFALWRRIGARILVMCVCGMLALTAQRSEERRVFAHVRDRLDRCGPHYLSGRVVSTPLRTGRGYTYELRCDSLCGISAAGVLHRKRIRCIGWEAPEYGRMVLLRGQYRAPRVDVTPGGFDEYRYLLSRGLWGTFLVDGQLQRHGGTPLPLRFCAAARRPVYATLAHVRDTGNRAVLQAALLGERVVPLELKATFRDAGISHLLAISGLHVGILTAALLCAFSLAPLSRRVVYPIVIIILWGYVAIVGAAPSLARAAIMATLILGSFVFQRTSRTLNALGIAGILWLLFCPASAFTPGYQLSFAATFGIVAGMRFCQNLMQDTTVSERPILKHLYNTVCVSSAAFLSTLPAVMYHFAAVSLFGLLANLVVVTLMTGCMWLFFMAIVLQTVWPLPAAVAMHGSSSLLSGIVGIAGLSRCLPPIETVRPPLLVCACYTALLVGLVTVRRRSLPAYLALAPPVVLIVAGSCILAYQHTRPLQFWWRSYGGTTAHVVGFPNGKAILVAPDSLEAAAQRDIRSFLSARHLRLTSSITTARAVPRADRRLPVCPGYALQYASSGECTVSVARDDDGVVACLSTGEPPRFDAAVARHRPVMPDAGFAIFHQAGGQIELRGPYAEHPLASEAGDCPFSGG